METNGVMDSILIAASEHLGAVGVVQALADIRRGAPKDAVAHLEEMLGRKATTPERGALIREIGNAARSMARSMLTEAEIWEDPDAIGIDVDAIERALADDEDAEPAYACRSCEDRGVRSFRDDEGALEPEPCACTWTQSEAA